MLSVRNNILGAVRVFCLLALLLALPAAMAQPSGARGDDFIYRVMPNDTLMDISVRFTGSSSNWTTLQSLNAVADPYALTIGRELRIPFALIPEVEAHAQITHIIGQVLLNQRPARLQEAFSEGDTLETLEHSFTTFRLPDGSISALPPQTSVHMQRLRTFLGTGLVDIILQLDYGDLESTVAPSGQGTGRYEVQTPVSITGVRGTRLRVRADDDGARTEVLTGAAQVGTTQADGPRVGALRGSAVTPDGKILASRALLSAPTLVPNVDDPYSRTIMFEPVPGAVKYHVRVSADPSGTQPVWTDTILQPPLHYRTPGSGQWYVQVRSVDDVGLMSADATLQVEGRTTLISGFGLSINTAYGEPVVLTDY